ncbi:hypothetical protein V8G54_026952, partial [Vigna mungo]
RKKVNPKVSLVPSYPANLPLPTNVSVQAWSAGVSRDEVVFVPVIGGVRSFDWNRHQQRHVLSYHRLVYSPTQSLWFVFLRASRSFVRRSVAVDVYPPINLASCHPPRGVFIKAWSLKRDMIIELWDDVEKYKGNTMPTYSKL